MQLFCLDISGIWLISILKFYFNDLNIKLLACFVIILAFASEFLAPLVKSTAVFDPLDIVAIIICGLVYCVILNKLETKHVLQI